MKKVLLVLSIVAMVGVAQANLLVFDNADFHDGLNGWGLAGDVTFSDGGGYGVMDGVAGGWGVFVATDAGIPLASLGVSAGDTITVEMDMILLAGAGNPGIKIESWGGGGHISNSGDINGAITGSWATYSWDYTIAAGADALKFVPLWGGGASVGYDNLSIVPEPATMALLGLGALVLRRKK
ncbi:MAG: PEP-CTERM sorting domain-containing protein [Planctomycetes bacterium]|nr:PEP-CTERM sorting domain-containing protein [Planctomycetota bacterium]